MAQEIVIFGTMGRMLVSTMDLTPSSVAHPANRGPCLRIVAINDVYSLQNLPSFKSLVDHHARVDPADRMLVTLAGDFLAPSILSSLDAGQGMVDCLNEIGISHVILGNHEDDIPVEQLCHRVQELKSTWISTNVFDVGTAMKHHDIIRVCGNGTRAVSVGILGVVSLDPSLYRRVPFGGARGEPANPCLLRESVRLVKEHQCACIVPLTHQSMADDRLLAHAQRHVRGHVPFPIILGGHEHVPIREYVENTWILKAGSDAFEAMIIDLVWSAEVPEKGTVDTPQVTIRVEQVCHYPEDSAVRRKVDFHLSKVRDLEQAQLLTISDGKTLSSVGTRCKQTTLGTLFCSQIRDALKADGCLINGGGIRGNRDYKESFSYSDLKIESPFDNEMVVVNICGDTLQAAIQASRINAPMESGGFLQVDDGMVLDEQNCILKIAGAPFDPSREYRIGIVRDSLLGMDRNEVLRAFAQKFPQRIPPIGSGREIKVALVDSFARTLWKVLGGFEGVDANGDGVITRLEVEQALARGGQSPPSRLTTDLLIGVYDADGDDLISRADMEAKEQKLFVLSGKWTWTHPRAKLAFVTSCVTY
jgi:2',3'-cyclic-nucleotide 2'-phosphodiesterase (5'-nucleotidase family)